MAATAWVITMVFDLREHTESFMDPLSPCSNACALPQRSQPSLLPRFMPAAVAGDSNCLFCAMSLAFFGIKVYHRQLCAMAAVEILSNPEWFDTTSQHCMHPLKDNAYVVLPSYTALFKSMILVNGVVFLTFWP